jgi:hypothetical protein
MEPDVSVFGVEEQDFNTERAEFRHRGHREEKNGVIYTRGSLVEVFRSEIPS